MRSARSAFSVGVSVSAPLTLSLPFSTLSPVDATICPACHCQRSLFRLASMHVLLTCVTTQRRLSHAITNVTRNAVRRLSTASQPPLLQHVHVRSASSPTFKRLLALHKQAVGSLPPISLLAEGRTLLQHLIASPWQLTTLLLTQHTLQKEIDRQSHGEPHLLHLLSPARPSTSHVPQLLQLSPPLLRRLSHASTPSEYMAEFTLPAAASTAPSATAAATVVLDGVSDPTNVASLLRSAHAFGFHRLAVRPGSCSPYNHKVVAGSAGSIAYMHIRQWDEQLQTELLMGKAQRQLYVVGLVVADGRPLREVAGRVRRRRAEGASVWLVVGNESRGLSEDMLSWCDELCTIPMSSEVESLNAAVAASIACYELGEINVSRGGTG